ncbi:Hypothetical predicted protein [Olea europaea subsp. europaea]|uniref:Uncharacterized protein n=1 Tax=Olea europaea subsp. europaea TaxID=158383 RepID=A0A8S0UIL5_OLEEU|nr:Hypothetical predicted protein [Olea europaea subsp. europaea]
MEDGWTPILDMSMPSIVGHQEQNDSQRDGSWVHLHVEQGHEMCKEWGRGGGGGGFVEEEGEEGNRELPGTRELGQRIGAGLGGGGEWRSFARLRVGRMCSGVLGEGVR